MARLLRPHIPLKIRCQVAFRQLGAKWKSDVLGRCKIDDKSAGELLILLLDKLSESIDCGSKDLRLDHDPALGAREKVFDPETREHVAYIPDANDPEYLVYREKGEHDVKTRIRGAHGQRSDLGLIKRNRKLERGPINRPKGIIKSRGFSKSAGKRPWPKRPFPKKRK